MQLPEEFVMETRRTLGDDRFARYLKAFEDEPPVSIRLNPMKLRRDAWSVVNGERVPWCGNGYYLPQRPNFTMDPLLHAGCYYVQEAASMFLEHILNSSLPTLRSLTNVLDLCAAPGGKSTLLRAALPADCMLTSNEPIAKRAQVLAENVAKWGYDNHTVTNKYPRDFVKTRQLFDLILCDVPCSGEGMFRKDAATISEWSPQQVEHCWRLQREIVSDAWQCLNGGGLLIYSTCTFNTRENEENVRWFVEQLGAEVVPVDGVKPEWNITGSLLEGFAEPVYRFIPGITRSEGLFICVMRKPGQTPERKAARKQVRNSNEPARRQARHNDETKTATPVGEVALTYPQALSYLRRESLVLPPDTPRGLISVSFMGQLLGLMKNIGTRANNLYPKEWRIKTTHTPTDYTPVISPVTPNKEKI